MISIEPVVDRLVSEGTDGPMREVIEAVRVRRVTDDELAYLARALAGSESVAPLCHRTRAVDLASTGGPTSLSTLLSPIYLRAMGCCVPKLGIPGRPAGGVDVLSRLPGYRVNLSDREVRECIERCGYVHFLAGGAYAPLDARFFSFRQRAGAQDIPELAIASLLAKKLAVGLNRSGLDVRVAPHGNFGAYWEVARTNAQRFQRVAAICAVHASCFLTDARFPYQPFVGRGEALVAVSRVLSGTAVGLLGRHATMCLAMAEVLAPTRMADPVAVGSVARDCFYENLSAQGSSREAFEEYVERTERGHRFELISQQHGFLRVHMGRLRQVFLDFQSVELGEESVFPDSLGVVLNKEPGELVYAGDLMASIRVDEKDWHAVERQFHGAIFASGRPAELLGFEEISHG